MTAENHELHHCRLTEWSVVEWAKGEQRICGRIAGDSKNRFPEGKDVATSPVVGGRIVPGGYVLTKSGTVYLLMEPHRAFDDWNKGTINYPLIDVVYDNNGNIVGTLSERQSAPPGPEPLATYDDRGIASLCLTSNFAEYATIGAIDSELIPEDRLELAKGSDPLVQAEDVDASPKDNPLVTDNHDHGPQGYLIDLKNTLWFHPGQRKIYRIHDIGWDSERNRWMIHYTNWVVEGHVYTHLPEDFLRAGRFIRVTDNLDMEGY